MKSLLVLPWLAASAENGVFEGANKAACRVHAIHLTEAD
jgi:hypothetical protein